MTDWVPALASIEGPRYLAFVLALEADIASGHVKPGMRLLPQRDMAQRLELSVGTISKAYAEAEQRGLISGEVGRGTFVQRRRDVEPARIFAASGPAPASRGDGDVARLTRRHRGRRPSFHHPRRTARPVDRARHGRSIRRYGPDRKLHIFGHAGAVGAMRLSPSRGRHRCIRADPGESRSRVYRNSGARSLLHADAANTDGNGDAAAAAASHRRDRSQA